MNAPKGTGGPAFPSEQVMSLRDIIAHDVLLAILPGAVPAISSGDDSVVQRMARFSYGIADAMLAAREQKPAGAS